VVIQFVSSNIRAVSSSVFRFPNLLLASVAHASSDGRKCPRDSGRTYYPASLVDPQGRPRLSGFLAVNFDYFGRL